MEGRYNMRSPAVKRLMKEAQELREPTEQYFAQPLEDNLFEWHFTIRGPSDSEFEGGIYHGRIILPPDYPMKPPSIMLLTPNGRFEIFKKICLSISGHHPESWQPSWSIRTALLAIIGFMPTHGSGAIGSLDYTAEERKVLAKKSQDWKCPSCGNVNNILKAVTEASEKTKQEAKELASQINFQGEKEKKEQASAASSSESGASAGVTSEPSPALDGASATSPTTPVTPPMFPLPMPGMPPFPPHSDTNQQFHRFPFPPTPFMMPPEWQQHMHRNMLHRFPPFMMNPSFPGPPTAMTGTSQMPPMTSWFPQPTLGQTNTTPSSSRPVMSSEKQLSPEAATTSNTSNTQSQSCTEASSPTKQTTSSSVSARQTTSSPATKSQSSTSHPATTSPSPSVTSASEGLRQRQTAQQTASPQQTTTPHPAPTFDQRPGQPSPGGIVSSGLMLVLGLAVLVLLVRRLYMMNVI